MHATLPELWAGLRFSNNKVPADILLTDNHALLAKWFCWFSTKARKLDGESYPPKTLQHYLMGIQQHIWKQKENQTNLMTDKEFIVLRNLLDYWYRRLHTQGVAAMRSQQKGSHRRMKIRKKLWDSGILNRNTSQGLLNGVFFLNN